MLRALKRSPVCIFIDSAQSMKTLMLEAKSLQGKQEQTWASLNHRHTFTSFPLISGISPIFRLSNSRIS